MLGNGWIWKEIHPPYSYNIYIYLLWKGCSGVKSMVLARIWWDGWSLVYGRFWMVLTCIDGQNVAFEVLTIQTEGQRDVGWQNTGLWCLWDIDHRIDCIELLILDPLRKQYSPISESSAGSAKAALCFLSLEIVSYSVPSIQRMVSTSFYLIILYVLLLLQFLFQPQVHPSTKL